MSDSKCMRLECLTGDLYVYDVDAASGRGQIVFQCWWSVANGGLYATWCHQAEDYTQLEKAMQLKPLATDDQWSAAT